MYRLTGNLDLLFKVFQYNWESLELTEFVHYKLTCWNGHFYTDQMFLTFWRLTYDDILLNSIPVRNSLNFITFMQIKSYRNSTLLKSYNLSNCCKNAITTILTYKFTHSRRKQYSNYYYLLFIQKSHFVLQQKYFYKNGSGLQYQY